MKTIVAITAYFSHICSEMETHVFRRSEYYQETADPSGMAGTVIHPSECTILFCVSGYALVSVNFVRRVVRRGDIVVVLSDTLLSVDAVSRTFRAKRIEVAANLLDEATFSLSSDFSIGYTTIPYFRQPENSVHCGKHGTALTTTA